MVLTLVTSLSYRVFLTTSLSTILLSLLKSTGTVSNLSISNSTTYDLQLSESAFLAKSDVSTPVVCF